DLDRGQHGGERDRPGALHVVVENAVLVAVGEQDAARVVGTEVLEVQQRAWEQRGGDPKVLVDELVVSLTAHPGVPVAEGQRVVEQLFVVGADVEGNGNHPARVDAGGRGVDGQLANRDRDAAHAPVADAEDLFGVAAHDQVNVVWLEPKGGERRRYVL